MFALLLLQCCNEVDLKNFKVSLQPEFSLERSNVCFQASAVTPQNVSAEGSCACWVVPVFSGSMSLEISASAFFVFMLFIRGISSRAKVGSDGTAILVEDGHPFLFLSGAFHNAN